MENPLINPMYMFLSTEAHQKLRFKRTALALFGGLIHTLVCFSLWYEGMFRTSLQIFILIFSFLWIVHLIFPILILTNINLKFKDPSLTLPALMWSQISVMISVYFVDELRPLLLLFTLFAMVFGGFQLKAKELYGVAFATLVMYVITILILAINHPLLISPPKEIVIAITYAVILLSFVGILSELSLNREHLQKKTMELQSSLLIRQNETDIDALTGLKNRRFIMDILKQQREIIERHRDYCFSLARMDIEQFKQINANFGHAIGEKVLQSFSEMVMMHLRKTDYFASLGNGEFLLVAPFTRKDQIKSYVERVLNSLEVNNFDHIVPNLKISCSAGITDFRWPESSEDTLTRADKALYLIKNQGGNRIEVD